jgi:hypothetical protein
MALINAIVEINLSGMLQDIVYVDQILCIWMKIAISVADLPIPSKHKRVASRNASAYKVLLSIQSNLNVLAPMQGPSSSTMFVLFALRLLFEVLQGLMLLLVRVIKP